MKKLFLAVSVLAIAFSSCTKDESPVSGESLLLGTWDNQKVEEYYEYGYLYAEDTTIRIVLGYENFVDTTAQGEFMLNFTSDSMFISDGGYVEGYGWNYSNDILYLDYTYAEYNEVEHDYISLLVETLDSSSLIFSFSGYYSYLEGGVHYYEDEVIRYYFDKVNSLQEVTVQVDRLIKEHKASFVKRMKEKRNRLR